MVVYNKNIIMDFALRELGAFPVYRDHRDHWAIRHAQKVLEHEQVLAMFPEGSRSKGRGLRAGKTGVARLAIQKDCPVMTRFYFLENIKYSRDFFLGHARGRFV